MINLAQKFSENDKSISVGVWRAVQRQPLNRDTSLQEKIYATVDQIFYQNRSKQVIDETHSRVLE